MTNESAPIVQRLWNYCNVLRDDGVSYGDYVEQLTYLLFLKMADEQTKPPFRKPSIIPETYAWPALTSRDGGDLETHYRENLIDSHNRLKALGLEKIFGGHGRGCFPGEFFDQICLGQAQ